MTPGCAAGFAESWDDMAVRLVDLRQRLRLISDQIERSINRAARKDDS